jgi:putative tryptophan/tyrosine transport system substrate-binding protein
MFSELLKRKPEALVVTAEPFTREYRTRILDFIARNAIPAMYEISEFVEAGGLMSYGPNNSDCVSAGGDLRRQNTERCQSGQSPAEQPTKFELVINSKTAKTLGLAIPDSILVLADKVVE